MRHRLFARQVVCILLVEQGETVVDCARLLDLVARADPHRHRLFFHARRAARPVRKAPVQRLVGQGGNALIQKARDIGVEFRDLLSVARGRRAVLACGAGCRQPADFNHVVLCRRAPADAVGVLDFRLGDDRAGVHLVVFVFINHRRLEVAVLQHDGVGDLALLLLSGPHGIELDHRAVLDRQVIHRFARLEIGLRMALHPRPAEKRPAHGVERAGRRQSRLRVGCSVNRVQPRSFADDRLPFAGGDRRCAVAMRMVADLVLDRPRGDRHAHAFGGIGGQRFGGNRQKADGRVERSPLRQDVSRFGDDVARVGQHGGVEDLARVDLRDVFARRGGGKQPPAVAMRIFGGDRHGAIGRISAAKTERGGDQSQQLTQHGVPSSTSSRPFPTGAGVRRTAPAPRWPTSRPPRDSRRCRKCRPDSSAPIPSRPDSCTTGCPKRNRR